MEMKPHLEEFHANPTPPLSFSKMSLIITAQMGIMTIVKEMVGCFLRISLGRSQFLEGNEFSGPLVWMWFVSLILHF